MAMFFWIPRESAAATNWDAALAKWTKTEERRDDAGGKFTIKATLYTSEYIETLMQSEAEKNLWTASELEDYKYNFLKGLNMDQSFAIHLEIEELGPTAHMAPFNEMLYLWIGKNKYSPSDYDTRFNMPLQGKRDGIVYFPRFDEKTGESLFKKDVALRLVFKAGISPVVASTELRFAWDVKVGSMDPGDAGRAVDRLEVDRLLKRMDGLAAKKAELEAQLEAANREIKEVSDRIEELQKK
jgi:hypothetical protein